MQRLGIQPRTVCAICGLIIGLTTLSMRLVPKGPDSDMAKLRPEAIRVQASRWLPESEETMLRYRDVARLLSSGHDQIASAELGRAASGTLLVQRSTSPDEQAEQQTSSVLLLQVVRGVAERAYRAADMGSPKSAARWIKHGRAMSSQVLRTPYATIEAVTLARSMDALLDRSEKYIAHRATDSITAVDKLYRLESRQREADRFWRTKILAQIEASMRSRQAVKTAACTQYDDACSSVLKPIQERWEEEDHYLAEDLIALYRSQRQEITNQA